MPSSASPAASAVLSAVSTISTIGVANAAQICVAPPSTQPSHPRLYRVKRDLDESLSLSSSEVLEDMMKSEESLVGDVQKDANYVSFNSS